MFQLTRLVSHDALKVFRKLRFENDLPTLRLRLPRMGLTRLLFTKMFLRLCSSTQALSLRKHSTCSAYNIIYNTNHSCCRRRLQTDKSQIGLHPTDTQLAKLRERSNLLLRKINTWTKVQNSYMPGTSIIRDHTDYDIDEAEQVPLLLPSAVGKKAVCTDVLRNYEWD